MTLRTVLAVDDEPMILGAVTAYLESRNYRVLTATNGRDALARFAGGGVDIVLLDLMLPDISGEEVCRAIRRTSNTPLIMLSAKVAENSQIEGFNIGADDYITKPFSLKVLEARIAALLRRAPANDPLELFADKRLTATERKIVNTLSRRPGKIFTRDELIETVFDDSFDGYDRVIDTHIKNLRRKIGAAEGAAYIKTVHGVGYKWGVEK
ncbi:MAG: response regulator transcription factor [Oscillospiraceae bacterium]|jgi:two-component system OmpR family response regulator|nr:response regulator transcription factor [Oscillospiraceae bacterium]